MNQNKETTCMEMAGFPLGQPLFDHKIIATLPIPLNEMSNYVTSCHSNNNTALYTQYEVIIFPSHHFMNHC